MRKLINPIPKDLDSLRHSANCIKLSASTQMASTESLMLYRPAKGLISKLSTYFDDVSAYLNGQIVGFANRKIVLQKTNVQRVLEENNYADLYDFKVPVPVGMSVDYNTLVETLTEMSEPISKMYDDTLYPFSQFIGSVINNPDKLQQNSMRQDVVLHDIAGMRDKLGKCLNKSNLDSLPLGKVFRRNTDFPLISDKLEKLLEEHKKVSPDLVASSVVALDENLTILMTKLQDDNEAYRVTPQKVKELSEICFALANEVSAYSIYTVVLEQAINSINKTNTLLVKKFK